MERDLGGGGFRSIKLNLTEGLAAIEDRTWSSMHTPQQKTFCSAPSQHAGMSKLNVNALLPTGSVSYFDQLATG